MMTTVIHEYGPTNYQYGFHVLHMLLSLSLLDDCIKIQHFMVVRPCVRERR